MNPRPVVLLFPGQGAQHVRMAAGLYELEPAFAAIMDECLACFDDGAALRADWLSARPRVDIDDARRAQPLLLAVDYALGRLVLDWGIRPVALLGHSVGETAAAVLADVLPFAAAAELTSRRVRRARDTPPGGMLAVAATPAELAELLAGTEVAIGAVNAPRQVVLAGLDEPLNAVERLLRAKGYTARRLPSHTAFHSPAVRSVADVADLADIPLRPARLPLFSAYTGGRLADADAVDPAFWATHPVAPVLFWPVLDRLLSAQPTFVIQAGPGQHLATIARRHPTVVRTGTACGLLPGAPGEPADDLRTFLATAEELRREGHVPVSA
ncbi:MAG TPA: acyltransferase domain-containing protein [Pseudonocardiaceae bacterium]|nr:acyltransferase domain-containing protein [Pseudonocardiaceae bacterium]